MKNINANNSIRRWFPAILVLFTVLIISCSNDFLNEQQLPSNYVEGDSIMISSDATSFSYEIDMLGEGHWQLLYFPMWLDVSPKEGILTGNSKVNLQFNIDSEKIHVDLGLHSFPLTFNVENVGQVQNKIILANTGTPEIKETPSEITSNYTHKGTYEIKNSGYGILIWNVVSKPDWLTLEKTEGVLTQLNYGIWNYSINTTGLQPGNYSGQVEIESNAQEQNFIINFHFTIESPGYYGDYLSGDFIDARYNKTLNQVIVLTKTPNNLLFFKTNSPYPDTLAIGSNTPKCLALSEDNKTIAVGLSNNTIATFDAENRTSLISYTLGTSPDKIEFGNDNWLYFLGEANYSTYLYSLNTKSKEIKKAATQENGLSVLKKVPGKNLLISSRKGWSPDNLFIFNIEEPSNVDSLNEYWIGLNNFYLSDDGERLFSGSQKVYKIPDYIPGQTSFIEAPPVIGEFNIGQGLKINDMAHQSSDGKIFIAYEEGYYRDITYIKQINDQAYTTQQTYIKEPIPPSDFPEGNSWWTETIKIFPSTNENELWAIRKYPAADYQLPDKWSIERIELQQ